MVSLIQFYINACTSELYVLMFLAGPVVLCTEACIFTALITATQWLGNIAYLATGVQLRI